MSDTPGEGEGTSTVEEEAREVVVANPHDLLDRLQSALREHDQSLPRLSKKSSSHGEASEGNVGDGRKEDGENEANGVDSHAALVALLLGADDASEMMGVMSTHHGGPLATARTEDSGGEKSIGLASEYTDVGMLDGLLLSARGAALSARGGGGEGAPVNPFTSGQIPADFALDPAFVSKMKAFEAHLQEKGRGKDVSRLHLGMMSARSGTGMFSARMLEAAGIPALSARSERDDGGGGGGGEGGGGADVRKRSESEVVRDSSGMSRAMAVPARSATHSAGASEDMFTAASTTSSVSSHPGDGQSSSSHSTSGIPSRHQHQHQHHSPSIVHSLRITSSPESKEPTPSPMPSGTSLASNAFNLPGSPVASSIVHESEQEEDEDEEEDEEEEEEDEEGEGGIGREEEDAREGGGGEEEEEDGERKDGGDEEGKDGEDGEDGDVTATLATHSSSSSGGTATPLPTTQTNQRRIPTSLPPATPPGPAHPATARAGSERERPSPHMYQRRLAQSGGISDSPSLLTRQLPDDAVAPSTPPRLPNPNIPPATGDPKETPLPLGRTIPSGSPRDGGFLEDPTTPESHASSPPPSPSPPQSSIHTAHARPEPSRVCCFPFFTQQPQPPPPSPYTARTTPTRPQRLLDDS